MSILSKGVDNQSDQFSRLLGNHLCLNSPSFVALCRAHVSPRFVAQKTKKQVFCSCNLPPSEEMFTFVLRKVAEEVKILEAK